MGVFDVFKKDSKNSTGCPDVPVAELKDDRFNVGQYISGLSSFILSCDTPMTISIQGDWGSGKTSMMNMIEANIKTLVYPIWFNTWQFSQFSLGNSLAISMIEVLLQRLVGDSSKLEKILNGVWGLAKNVALTATEITVGSRVASKAEEAVGGAFAGSYVKEILILKEQFQKAVNEKLSATKCSRVVVFVDDLDRLHPAKAVELLEVLKLFLDCENCVFVLAVDYEVVTLGIKQRYGSDVNAQKGKSFFDKIIQLPFKMPVAQYDIASYVRDMMERMKISVTDNSVKLFASLIKTSIGLNPRSMKRLFNTYQLLEIITKGAVKNIPDDTRQRILFATVCLQMNFDTLYNYLAMGNVKLETLNNLSKVTSKTIQHFILRQNTENDRADIEADGEDILEEIFERDDFSEENNRSLQRLPLFLKFFLVSITGNNEEVFTETDVRYLRDIMQCSAVTSVSKAEPEEIATEAWNNRSYNRRLAQTVNELLKGIADFRVFQPRKKENGVIPSRTDGITILKITEGEELKLEYTVDQAEKFGISVGLYLGKYEEESKNFFITFGENPLGCSALPRKGEEGSISWYYYDDILTVGERDDNAPHQIARLIHSSYENLQKSLLNLKKN